jgi:hypothetical protein
MNTSEKLRIFTVGVVCVVVYFLSDWDFNYLSCLNPLQNDLVDYASLTVKVALLAFCLLWCLNCKAYKLCLILIGALLLAMGRLEYLAHVDFSK